MTEGKMQRVVLEDDYSFDFDENELLMEWKRQPTRHYRMRCLLADAQKVMDHCENQLKLTMAEVEEAIRADFDTYGLVKGTEAEVKAAIPRQPEVKTAQKRLATAKADFGYISAGLGAEETRRRALENAVELYKSGYWNSDMNPGATNHEMVREINKDEARGKSRIKK